MSFRAGSGAFENGKVALFGVVIFSDAAAVDIRLLFALDKGISDEIWCWECEILLSPFICVGL